MRSRTRTITRPYRAIALVAAAALLPMTAGRHARAQPGEAFVRVNQVGYVEAATKRAYLMSSTAEEGRASR